MLVFINGFKLSHMLGGKHSLPILDFRWQATRCVLTLGDRLNSKLLMGVPPCGQLDFRKAATPKQFTEYEALLEHLDLTMGKVNRGHRGSGHVLLLRAPPCQGQAGTLLAVDS